MDEALASLRDFVPFATSTKCAVNERLARWPKPGAAFPIAIGDYVDPHGEIARAKAQHLFWHAFAAEAPDAVRQLFDECSTFDEGEKPLYETLGWDAWLEEFAAWYERLCAWFDRYGFHDPDSDPRTPDINRSTPDSFLRLRGDVTSALTAEADTSPECLPIHINGEPRVIRTNPTAALSAYHAHCLSPILTRGTGYLYIDLDDPLDLDLSDDIDYRVSSMGWNPVFEMRAAAKARHMATFARLLDEALEKREWDALARGLVPATTTKRTTEHFRWLVRYQCLGQTYDAIARDARKDRTTVREGVAAAAALLGITVRKPMRRGGRPRKKRAHTIRWTRHSGG